MRRRLPLLLVLATVAAVPAIANAAQIGREADDPTGDSTSTPANDLVHGAWLFDKDTGRWIVSATFAAQPTSTDWAKVNAVLRDASAPGCTGTVVGTVNGSNEATTASGGAGSEADGTQPDGSVGPSYGPASNTKSDDGRTTVLDFTHARLVGREVRCVQITISHNGVLDRLDLPLAGESTATPTPGDPATPTPTPGPGQTQADPATVRLASSHTLRFRRNASTAGLVGLAAGMKGALSVALPNHITLATGTYTAQGAIPLTVKVTLTTKGKRYLKRHRSAKAKLTLRTTLGARQARRSYAVRVRRG